MSNNNTQQNEEILRRLETISEQIQESEDDRKADKIDYAIAVLLGIATVLGALAAYWSAIWGGNSAAGYNKANFAISENSTAYLEALTDASNMEFTSFKDDIMYVEYNEATSKGETGEAEYFKAKMSDEYAAMLDANNVSPEAMDAAIENWSRAYEQRYMALDTAMTNAITGIEQAKAMQSEADVQNGHGDAFTFVTVLFTITLFFGGMAAVSKNLRLKMIYGAGAIIAFVYSVIQMFMIPMP